MPNDPDPRTMAAARRQIFSRLAQTQESCSWCDTLNPLTRRWCQQCGHAAHLARAYCDCASCRGAFDHLKGGQSCQ